MENTNKRLNGLLADIKTLDYESLVKLNRIVVDRLKLLQKLKQTFELMRFDLNDRVHFYNNGRKITGIITRVNQRTVSVVNEKDPTDSWRVAPSLLSKSGLEENDTSYPQDQDHKPSNELPNN